MTLTLKVINRDRLDNGASPELVLNNRGANIGRSLTCEWVLPDETRSVSGKHCEIQFRDNAYFLIDFGSTNGTFVGQSDQRLEGAHKIAPGDRFRIGPYMIEARLAGTALHQYQGEAEQAAAAAKGPAWGDWDDVPGARPAPPPAPPAFDPDAGFGWELPKAAGDRASTWSEDVGRASSVPTADDIFDAFTAKNEVDWNNASWSVDPAFDPFGGGDTGESGFAPLPGASRAAAPGGGGGGGFAPLPGAGSSGGGGGGDDSFAPLPGGSSNPGGGFAPLPGGFDSPPAPAPVPMPPPAPAPAAAPRPAPVAHDPFGPLSGAEGGDVFGALPEPSPPPAAPFGGSFAPLEPGPAPVPSPATLPAASPPPSSWQGDAAPEATVGPWGQEPAFTPAPVSAAPSAPGAAHPPPRVRPSPVPHDLPPPQPTAAPAPPLQSVPAPAPAPEPARPDVVFGALLAELGVHSSQLKLSPEESAAKTGRMLRHLLAGLMVLLEARARAKEEMGAAGTALGFDGNNPLKFARNVDQALQMMLNPKLRGYMEAEDAIEEAYRDLQAHQIATLKAMQGALRETLNRFSPTAIKARTKDQGLLAKVLPGQREAALWKAYEAQFSGVAEGSAEAFLEVFSREFRKAYDEASQRPRR